MNKEQLQRGNDIQDYLHALRSQLERLQRTDRCILSELANNCSGKIYSELEDIEKELKDFAIRRVKVRIEKLETEFKKL